MRTGDVKMSREPKNDRISVILKQARELHINGNVTEAEELLQMILRELDKDNAEAHWRLGLINQEKGDTQNALREYRSAARSGIVSKREQDYSDLNTKVSNLENFSKEDLRNFIAEIASINGTIHPVAIDYIIDNFDDVKRELGEIAKQDSVSDSAIIDAFENLKGTFATPGLISNILFLRNKNQYSICTSLLVQAIAKIGLFNQVRSSLVSANSTCAQLSHNFRVHLRLVCEKDYV